MDTDHSPRLRTLHLDAFKHITFHLLDSTECCAAGTKVRLRIPSHENVQALRFRIYEAFSIDKCADVSFADDSGGVVVPSFDRFSDGVRVFVLCDRTGDEVWRMATEAGVDFRSWGPVERCSVPNPDCPEIQGDGENSMRSSRSDEAFTDISWNESVVASAGWIKDALERTRALGHAGSTMASQTTPVAVQLLSPPTQSNPDLQSTVDTYETGDVSPIPSTSTPIPIEAALATATPQTRDVPATDWFSPFTLRPGFRNKGGDKKVPIKIWDDANGVILERPCPVREQTLVKEAEDRLEEHQRKNGRGTPRWSSGYP
jgi:hypothetical protein